jgi:hypothetical protein
MSIEIGELIIQTQLVTHSTTAPDHATGRLSGAMAHKDHTALVDEIVSRVVEQLREQWRGQS